MGDRDGHPVEFSVIINSGFPEEITVIFLEIPATGCTAGYDGIEFILLKSLKVLNCKFSHCTPGSPR